MSFWDAFFDAILERSWRDLGRPSGVKMMVNFDMGARHERAALGLFSNLLSKLLNLNFVKKFFNKVSDSDLQNA